MFLFPRHCERSEAIQSKWGAVSHCALIAMMVSVLACSNPALACSEESSLASRLNVYNHIFEGHVDRLENVEIINPENNELRYLVVHVFKVDKSWKGAEKGEEFYVWPQYGLSKDHKIDLPPLKNTPQVILTLNEPRVKSGNKLVFQPACPEFYPVTSNNNLLLSARFPSAAFQ